MRTFWFIYKDFIADFPSDLVVAMGRVLIGHSWERAWTTALRTVCLEYEEKPLLQSPNLQNHLTSVLLCWTDFLQGYPDLPSVISHHSFNLWGKMGHDKL